MFHLSKSIASFNMPYISEKDSLCSNDKALSCNEFSKGYTEALKKKDAVVSDFKYHT